MAKVEFITRKIADAIADIYDENNNIVDNIDGIIVEEKQLPTEENEHSLSRWYFCTDNSCLDGTGCQNKFGKYYSWVFASIKGLINFEEAHFPKIFKYDTLREWEEKTGKELYSMDLEFSTWDYSDDYDEDDDESPLYEMEIRITKLVRKNNFNKIKI